MSIRPNTIEAHYDRHDGLVPGILDALGRAGHDVDALDPSALSGVDEFHLGGRSATLALLEPLREDPPGSVLDVGCGIGGPARTVATELRSTVHGIDLTASFVAAATELTARVGLADRVTFAVGDALALAHADAEFDLVTLLHVGMNIADKAALCTELARVVRPGGRVLLYDIMRIGPGDLRLPLPWAESEAHQHLAEVPRYLEALGAAGLEPGAPIDHRPVVRAALDRAAADPPPVTLTHLMGPDFAEMFSHLRAAVAAGVVAPIQIVATKPT